MVRIPLFLLGILALLLAIAIEGMSATLLPEYKASSAVAAPAAAGLGIRSLIFLDVIIAYVVGLILLEFFPPVAAMFSRVQGPVTLVLSAIGALASLVFVIAAINLITLMLALLLSPPFGTVAYFAVWGTFNKTPSRIVVDLALFLKIVGVAFVLVSYPSFLKNRKLMLLLLCSVGLTFVLGLLHALPPSFLVAITDALGAIITGIVALVWMIAFLIGAIFAIIRLVRNAAPV